MKAWFIGVLMLVCGVFALQQRRFDHRVATAAVEAFPVQRDEPQAPSFDFHGVSLQPKATYHIDAKLLSKERYRWGESATLAPWDFAMGWGPMSHEEVVKQLGIEQSARFYTYRWSDEPPIAVGDIVRNSANMHLIPASAAVREQLDRARPGYRVVLDGQLVNATWADGSTWTTSLTREDTGGGACEVMFVERVSVSLP